MKNSKRTFKRKKSELLHLKKSSENKFNGRLIELHNREIPCWYLNAVAVLLGIPLSVILILF